MELLSTNGGRFKISQLLFADDTVLVADSEEKFWRLVSEFGRVCKHCRKKEVSFSMTIGNEELMHECFPKHLRMGTARMK